MNLATRTQRERHQIASMGAKACNEKKRARNTLKESMNALLEMQPTAKEIKELEKAGFNPEEIDNSLLVVLGLFNQAKKGNVKAIKELRNLIGEDGPDNGNEYESDGFIDALKDDMESTIEKAGDFIET